MARSILFKTDEKIDLNIKTKIEQDRCTVSNNYSDSILRRKRSKEYIESCKKLDATSCANLDTIKNEVINSIKSEFEDIDVSMPVMKGIVAKCYLGEDYEVHTLDLALSIVNHYRKHQALPNGLEQARNLANNVNYAFVEIYNDFLIAVSKNGDAFKINI